MISLFLGSNIRGKRKRKKGKQVRSFINKIYGEMFLGLSLLLFIANHAFHS